MDNKRRHEEVSMSFPDLQEVRRDPGRYLPMLDRGLGEKGVHLLLWEILENAIDEAAHGQGSRIEAGIYNSGQCAVVRDYGRGIPHGEVVGCMTRFGCVAGGCPEAEQRAGMGVKVVNALSRRFAVRSYRAGKVESVVFENGLLLARKLEYSLPAERDGTYVCFSPSPAVFARSGFSVEAVEAAVRVRTKDVTNLVMSLNGQTVQAPA